MTWSSLARETEELEVLREWLRSLVVPAVFWPSCIWAMNSQDGAVCGSNGEELGFLLRRCGGIEASCDGTEMGGISGDDARVVPDQNEGTGEDGDATLGTCSH